MKKPQNGFSLVEIVIALGIVSFAMVAILGLFPMAMNDSQTGRHETHAAMIAQMIVSQLRSQAADESSFPVGTNAQDGNQVTGNMGVDLKQGTDYYAVYDEAGKPLTKTTMAEYDGAFVPPTISPAIYKVAMKVQPGIPRVGVSKVTVDVTYPCAAELAKRKFKYTFVTQLRNVE